MKKRVLISILIVVTTCMIGIFLSNSIPKSPVLLSTSSPSGLYKVSIEESTNPIDLALFSSDVSFSAYKNTALLVKSEHLVGFDNFPSQFLSIFPNAGWIGDNILIFRNKDYSEKDDDFDRIVINNVSDRPLKYIRINTKELCLIFDLGPKQRLELNIPHQKWISWVEASGMFDDGTRIPSSGTNFSHKDQLGNSLHYCVSVINDRLVVQSPVMEGFENNVTIPIAPGCDKY